jgi:regulator of protease activity HflC (stomatin/prohibitin superfamily)
LFHEKTLLKALKWVLLFVGFPFFGGPLDFTLGANYRGGIRMARWSRFFCGLFVMVGLLCGCTNPFTPAGHEGYVYEDPRVFGKGGFQGTLKGPANFGVSPWRNRVINIDMRPQTFREKFRILTADDLNVSFSFHSVLDIRGGTVQKVVEQYGAENWYERFLQKPLRTYVRESVQSFTSAEIKQNRNEVADRVETRVGKYLEKTPFRVIDVVVGNIDYPEVVTRAVEAKLAAQQLLQEKETQKEIARRDAEIRIEEARGIAEAQRIINSTLTPNYLQHEAIQAQRVMANAPNHTTVYIPVGNNGIPMVYGMDQPSEPQTE